MAGANQLVGGGVGTRAGKNASLRTSNFSWNDFLPFLTASLDFPIVLLPTSRSAMALDLLAESSVA